MRFGGKLHTMNIRWDAEKYTADFSYVHQYGHDVMRLPWLRGECGAARRSSG